MPDLDRLRVLFAGGGTGGHLYPAIAVARELLRRDAGARVSFVGTASGLEAKVLPREQLDLDLIRSAGLKGKSVGSFVRGVSLLPVSAADAWQVLSRRAPHVVVGVGGYSSGPVVMLAALRRIPTMVLEQNAIPGVTNRLLARVVDAAATTYDATLPYFRGNAFVSGNPVRAEFFDAEPKTQPAAESPVRILIFGGSQGAHAINVAMVAAAPDLAKLAGRVAITHQTGERDLEMVREAYGRTGLDVRVAPFLFEMDREMKAAHLVVCRAGATTLAELAAAGRPAILVPLPTATDDHQRQNAQVVAAAGAAELIPQGPDLTGALAERIAAVAGDESLRRRMSERMRALARPDAARVIVDRLLEVAGRS